jgi:hypothetical protein
MAVRDLVCVLCATAPRQCLVKAVIAGSHVVLKDIRSACNEWLLISFAYTDDMENSKVISVYQETRYK